MSLGAFGSSRRSAIAALSLALGSSCATSEEPNPEYPSGGSAGALGGAPSPPGGSPSGGSPEPSAGKANGGSGNVGQGGASAGSKSEGGTTSGGTSSAGMSSGGKASGGASAGRGGTPAAGAPSGGRGGSEGGRGGSEGGRANGGTPNEGGASGGVGGGGTGEGARASCDWSGCSSKSCETACPTMDGGDCANRCGALITCVQKSSATCPTADDPMCVKRTGATSAENECTAEWETAGGSADVAGPSKVAALYFECACEEELE